MLKKLFSNKKKIALLLILTIAIAVGAFAYFQMRDNDSANDSINYNPPTKNEREAADSQKDKNIEREKADNNQVSQKAEIVVVDASQYGDTVEVRAYISNIYEDGGSCTATITNGSQTVSRDTKGFKDATTTQCEPFNIPRSAFSSAGDWQAKVSYSSAAAKGESSAQTINIK